MTLRQLVEQHPDWLDYEMAIYRVDGEYDYVGQSGAVYLYNDKDFVDAPVIVFDGS